MRPRPVSDRRGRLAVLALLLAALGAAPGFAEPMVLRRGTSAEPPTLDPNLGAGSLAAPLIADLFVGLLARGPDSRPTPGAAESWSVSEDGRVYRFRLREGLRWSDGKPLTAEDFVYSYRRLMDPATGSRLVAVFYPIVNAREIVAGELPPDALGVSAPDPLTVEFRLLERTPYFIELLGNLQAVPVPRHVIEAEGAAWTRAGTMVTNGPFVLAERVPQSFIRLEKNPYYHEADAVALDEVRWYPTQDLATSFKRFRAGELDMALNFPPSETDWIRENLPDALHVTPNLGVYFIALNLRQPPFDDPRVREALSLAIDREAITDRVLRNGARPAYSFATPEFSGYDGIRRPWQDEPLARRQARARTLLAEVGYGDGRPLTVELQYDTQEENRRIMVAVAAMWQAIGVRTTISDVEFRMLNRLVRTRQFEAARWFYVAAFDDPYAKLQLFMSDNPNNWPGFESPDYDALLKTANASADPARRLELLAAAERVLMAANPVLPISYYVARRLISPQVQGWVDSPAGPTPSRYLSIER